MDYSGALRRFHALPEGPCAHFVRASGEERTEFEQRICGFDKAVDARLLQSDLPEEHLPLLVALQFGYLAFYLRGEDEHLCVFVLHSLFHLLDVGVAADSGSLIDVADVHDGFVGEEEKVLGSCFLLFVLQLHRPGILTLT